MHPKITIIGAGLTGITLAYLLKQEGIEAQIIEARPRVGGRIFTKMSGNHIPIDLGAAWFWEYNTRLRGLLQELKIESFPQHIGSKVWYQPHNQSDFEQIEIPKQPVSFRIKGGTTNLILNLCAHLSPDQLHLDTAVQGITYKYSKYSIKTSKGNLFSDIVISTIPPALLSNIDIEPALPQEYIDISQNTHTWMQDSIKFGLGFKNAFWKSKDLPATAFSNYEVISELYDYSNQAHDRTAMMGFLKEASSKLSKSQRQQQVQNLIASFLGEEVFNSVSYEECDWSQDPFTKKMDAPLMTPHQNNGHPMLRSVFNQNTFLMAGSETSSQYPGYMEGAVNSAYETFAFLMK